MVWVKIACHLQYCNLIYSPVQLVTLFFVLQYRHRTQTNMAATCMKLNMMDLTGDSSSFEQYLESFSANNKSLIKISIAGPEYDAMGMEYEDEDDEPEHVPEHRVKTIFGEISALPALGEIVIDPGYYSGDGPSMLDTSRVCWLLSSKKCKVETLRIKDLDVHSDSDVEELALALKGCPSIKALCIEQILVGYRDVKTLLPLMEVIAQLPNLTKLRLVIDAFGNTEASVRYASESLPVLKTGRGLDNVQLEMPMNELSIVNGPEHPVLSNCNDLSAFI